MTCVVDLFGPTDFTVLDGKFSFIGGSPKDHLDLVRSASPVNYVHGEEPPMLVVHGTVEKSGKSLADDGALKKKLAATRRVELAEARCQWTERAGGAGGTVQSAKKAERTEI